MINLSTHPVFKSVGPLKKRGHITKWFLAKQYIKMLPRNLFVGVTGSVGKTLTTLACQLVLSEAMPTLATTSTMPGMINLDPIFNLPATILKIKPNIKKVIMEFGLEYPGEMDLYLDLVKPATAIITKLDYAHSQFLGDLPKIIEEKGRLIEQLPDNGVAILNWDDLNSRKLAEKTQAEVVYYGTDQKNCHVWAGNMRVENFHNVFELNYGVERVSIESETLGFHQIYPLLAAASLGVHEGLSLTTIKKGLEKVPSVEHRMQVFQGYNGSVVLDDTYNSSPAALEEALETLNHVPARRRIVVLGEMRELGEFSEKLHRDIARKIYTDKIDLVLTGGGDAKYIADELLKLGFIPERLHSDLQNPQIVSILLKAVAKGDVVLVKASKDVKFNEVVQRIIKPKNR